MNSKENFVDDIKNNINYMREKIPVKIQRTHLEKLSKNELLELIEDIREDAWKVYDSLVRKYYLQHNNPIYYKIEDIDTGYNSFGFDTTLSCRTKEIEKEEK